MKKRLMISLGVAMCLAIQPTVALAQGEGADYKKKSRELANRIDRAINKKLAEEGVEPGKRAGLGQLARRLHIDLAGKIPTVVEFADLIDVTNDAPTKFEDRVDTLLASGSYSYNFTNYWRGILLYGGNQQLIQNLPQFDLWLRNRLHQNVGYDKMTREILTSQGAPNPKAPNQPLPAGATPQAFYQVNATIENQAGSTARIFMGIKIECAQCHQHPFASWSRLQFWELAAFFDNNGTRRIPQTDIVAKAKYLTGEMPEVKGNSYRVNLAEWLTTAQNPFFAKATVDHVWQYFFGVSLIEPILEATADSPPANPELLDELAKGFTDSGFDLKFLVRSIVLSDAYQRVSVALSEASKAELQLFAKVPVRGMLPEQLYDSIGVATGLKVDTAATQPGQPIRANPQNNQRQQFLNMFYSQDKRIESQTSILQALYLMNGPMVRDRASYVLDTIGIQNTTTQRRVEAIYMLVLSRLPTPAEMERMSSFIERGGGSGDPRQAAADICWVLLNSSEFLLNH